MKSAIREVTLLQTSREIFQKVASTAEKATKVNCRPLGANVYVENGKSIVSLVRTDNRVEGIERALQLIGGIKPAINNLNNGYVLVKPNCNSHHAFPASTHPQTLKLTLRLLAKDGVKMEQIVVGDMSGPAWLPTEATMKKNGILKVTRELGIKTSFFEKEEWVWVKPEQALAWPEGFRIAKTAYHASRVISLPCLKTHQYGGVFTLSLKNSVGLINPADRNLLHKKPGARIAEINLAYTANLIILDGMRCFVSGGPAQGKAASPGVIIAGGDRVSVDVVGVAVLKFLKAKDIVNVKVGSHEQLRRATETGVGHLDVDKTSLKVHNMVDDDKFDEMVEFIRHQL